MMYYFLYHVLFLRNLLHDGAFVNTRVFVHYIDMNTHYAGMHTHYTACTP